MVRMCERRTHDGTGSEMVRTGAFQWDVPGSKTRQRTRDGGQYTPPPVSLSRQIFANFRITPQKTRRDMTAQALKKTTETHSVKRKDRPAAPMPARRGE